MNGKIKAISTLLMMLLASVHALPYVYALTLPVAAPDFTLTDIDGNTFKLGDYSGKRVLLEFFYIG
jgi:cytochrome oxidase Cu insertion factor (SCO1/SenC/PrrC family)